MFTGIITNLGEIIDQSNNRLRVKTDSEFIEKLTTGDSVSINGICLTVVDLNKNSFTVDVMPETRQKTNLKYAKLGYLVNLELPTTPNTFFSGHIVQGHVDGVVRLEGVVKKGNSRIVKFSMPNNLSKYIAEKGSIALNGISLTVIETGKNHFTVGIVPYTWDKTMLHTLKFGDFVNIEVDILAKYLERLVKK